MRSTSSPIVARFPGVVNAHRLDGHWPGALPLAVPAVAHHKPLQRWPPVGAIVTIEPAERDDRGTRPCFPPPTPVASVGQLSMLSKFAQQ
jgi:hypothetical protein